MGGRAEGFMLEKNMTSFASGKIADCCLQNQREQGSLKEVELGRVVEGKWLGG